MCTCCISSPATPALSVCGDAEHHAVPAVPEMLASPGAGVSFGGFEGYKGTPMVPEGGNFTITQALSPQSTSTPHDRRRLVQGCPLAA